MKLGRSARQCTFLFSILASAAAVSAGVTATAGEAPAVARLFLIDGSVLDGLVLKAEAAGLSFRGRNAVRDYPLGSVRLVSFAAADDYWRDRKLISAQAHTLILRNGRSVSGTLESISTDGVLWRDRSRKRAHFPIASIKRIYLNPRGFDFGESGGPETRVTVDPRAAERLASLTAEAHALSGRIAATAHHGDPFEQQAIQALAGFERAAAGLAAQIAEPDPDGIFRATEQLNVRGAEVDQAMDALHAYESVRASWSQLSDFVLPEVLEEVKRALQTR